MRALVLILLLALAAPAQAPANCDLEKLSEAELKALDLLLNVPPYGLLCDRASFEEIYDKGCADGLVKPMKAQHRDPRKEPDYEFRFERAGEKVRAAFTPKKKELTGFLMVDEMVYCNPAGAAAEKDEHLLGAAPDLEAKLVRLKEKRKPAK